MSRATPTDIERLTIDHACRELVLRAADAADAADADRLARLFTDDAQLQRPGGDVLAGRAAILASYRARPADRISRHLVVSTLVEVASADRARGLSRVLVWSGNAADEPGPYGRRASRQLLGAFDDEFERRGPTWLIAKRRAYFELYAEPA